jgi:hypothetical protein
LPRGHAWLLQASANSVLRNAPPQCGRARGRLYHRPRPRIRPPRGRRLAAGGKARRALPIPGEPGSRQGRPGSTRRIGGDLFPPRLACPCVQGARRFLNGSRAP